MRILQLLVLSVLILLFAWYIQPSQDASSGAAQTTTGDVEPPVMSDVEPAVESDDEPADILGPASSLLRWVRPPGQLGHRGRSR